MQQLTQRCVVCQIALAIGRTGVDLVAIRYPLMISEPDTICANLAPGAVDRHNADALDTRQLGMMRHVWPKGRYIEDISGHVYFRCQKS